MQISATHAKALWKRVKTSLTDLYGEEEATSISFRLIEDLAGINKSAVLAEQTLAAEAEEIILSALDKLQNGIPVQYVIGFTWFAGLKIEVNPSVLIPRPETEELFYLIKNEHQGPKKIMDWCSGSGCLTLALQHAFPNGEVYGLELSAQAIDTAKKSSSALGIQPCWRQSNIFETWPEEFRNCDIIVSNPPYVAQKEADSLSKHVLDHEPHLALFVPDHTPLLFYERLLQSGKEYLKPGGKLYCEINPIYAEELLVLAITLGWKDAQIRKDMFGKERFLIAHHQY